MAKSAEKRTKRVIRTKKPEKSAENQIKTAEYVSCLLELHKLQGVLLAQLNKQIQ